MNDIDGCEALEQIAERVAERVGQRIDQLERRIAALERTPQPPPSPAVRVAATVPALSAEPLPLPQGSGVFSLLGKAMLGIAGAYILRALGESTVLPRTAVAAVALLYAFLWLIAAARAPVKAWWTALTWTVTSALILLPMLWELTLRFQLLPDTIAAALLAAFVLLASVLAWRHHFAEVASVTEAAASIGALLLAIATRDPLPFLATLFVIAAAGEFAAARHRRLRVRLLVAAVLDSAVFALIWIYSGPSHADYSFVGAGLLLSFSLVPLLIYAGSATAQTLFLRRRISFFETAQTLIAFVLAAWAVLLFGSGHGAAILGSLCLLAAAAGYLATFSWFGRAEAQRNYHVYATGSLALLLGGSILSLPPTATALLCGALAVIAAAVGARLSRLTLQAHGLALITAAAITGGLLAWDSRVLAGTFPAGPGWILLLVSIFAVLTYAALLKRRLENQAWFPLGMYLLLAALATSAVVALLVWLSVRITAAAIAPGSEHIAVIRTLVGCAAALGLAASATLGHRKELAWLSWTALAFIAVKLLLEDLRHGHLAWTAASIFLYAVTLLLVPRLIRRRPSAAPATLS